MALLRSLPITSVEVVVHHDDEKNIIASSSVSILDRLHKEKLLNSIKELKSHDYDQYHALAYGNNPKARIKYYKDREYNLCEDNIDPAIQEFILSNGSPVWAKELLTEIEAAIAVLEEAHANGLKKYNSAKHSAYRCMMGFIIALIIIATLLTCLVDSELAYLYIIPAFVVGFAGVQGFSKYLKKDVEINNAPPNDKREMVRAVLNKLPPVEWDDVYHLKNSETFWIRGLTILIKYQSFLKELLHHCIGEKNLAFLMGSQSRLGEESVLYHNFFHHPLFDKKILPLILDKPYEAPLRRL